MTKTQDKIPTEKTISVLHDVPDFVPIGDTYGDWIFRIFDRSQTTCKNYLSPNRRDFYLIIYLNQGEGIFSNGLKMYHINKPTLLFIQPSDIISWKNHLSNKDSGYFCMLKKEFIDMNPSLKLLLEKYGVYLPKGKSVIDLERIHLEKFDDIFQRMMQDFEENGPDMHWALGASIQLLLIEAEKIGNFLQPVKVDSNYKLVHTFFEQLESEIHKIDTGEITSSLNASDFAYKLGVHPNYLNELLKKYTGKNVSSLIKNRVLEEAKALLLFTDKTLWDISELLGFSDQSNFSYFFKQKTGESPKKFRENSVMTEHFSF